MPLVAGGGFDPLLDDDDGDGDGDGWMATLARRGKRARILRASPADALVRDFFAGEILLLLTRRSFGRGNMAEFPFNSLPIVQDVFCTSSLYCHTGKIERP